MDVGMPCDGQAPKVIASNIHYHSWSSASTCVLDVGLVPRDSLVVKELALELCAKWGSSFKERTQVKYDEGRTFDINEILAHTSRSAERFTAFI